MQFKYDARHLSVECVDNTFVLLLSFVSVFPSLRSHFGSLVFSSFVFIYFCCWGYFVHFILNSFFSACVLIYKRSSEKRYNQMVRTSELDKIIGANERIVIIVEEQLICEHRSGIHIIIDNMLQLQFNLCNL